MKKILSFILVLSISFLSALSLHAQVIPKDSLYLGQTPPGTTPKLFKLPVPDKFFNAERIVISKDNKNIYYQELDGYPELDGKPHSGRLKYFSFKDGKWSEPKVLFENFGAPSFSNSEDTMFIQTGGWQSYYIVKKSNGWGAPIKFSKKIKYTHYLQITNNRNYYCTSVPVNSIGGLDRCRIFINGTDTTITSLGIPLNSAGHDFDFFVSKDESYVILVTPDNCLSISYHKKEGSWTNPKNLGKLINSGIGSWGPYVTTDNKYLFYTTGTQADYSDTGIYWIALGKMIDSLKATNYAPYLKNKLSDQSVKAGQTFSYTFPENSFIDDDGNNTLTYSATLRDGNTLPSWLRFNSAERTFSGTPAAALAISIKVTATDKAGESVSSTFSIKVVNGDGTADNGMVSGKPYFGQILPGETPVLFVPEVLNSLSVFVETTDLSPDGTKFFAAVGNENYTYGKLYYSKIINNAWSSFKEAPFAAGFEYANEPVFLTDGASLMFSGRKGISDKMDLWIVTYKNQTWSVPVKLPAPINSSANDFRASFMSDGTFYFTSNRDRGMNQIYKGTMQSPSVELLGPPINTHAYEGDPCIAPDGRFLVFHSGRAGGFGGTDLYVSFRNEKGEWGTPINLGPKFNSTGDEYGSHLSSDGKNLFFTSHTLKQNYNYWVAISAIEKLRH